MIEVLLSTYFRSSDKTVYWYTEDNNIIKISRKNVQDVISLFDNSPPKNRYQKDTYNIFMKFELYMLRLEIRFIMRLTNKYLKMYKTTLIYNKEEIARLSRKIHTLDLTLPKSTQFLGFSNVSHYEHISDIMINGL